MPDATRMLKGIRLILIAPGIETFEIFFDGQLQAPCLLTINTDGFILGPNAAFGGGQEDADLGIAERGGGVGGGLGEFQAVEQGVVRVDPELDALFHEAGGGEISDLRFGQAQAQGISTDSQFHNEYNKPLPLYHFKYDGPTTMLFLFMYAMNQKNGLPVAPQQFHEFPARALGGDEAFLLHLLVESQDSDPSGCELGATALGAAPGGFHERLFEALIHGADQTPSAHVGHLHFGGGVADGTGVPDEFEQLHLARTQGDILAAENPEAHTEGSVGRFLDAFWHQRDDACGAGRGEAQF